MCIFFSFVNGHIDAGRFAEQLNQTRRLINPDSQNRVRTTDARLLPHPHVKPM